MKKNLEKILDDKLIQKILQVLLTTFKLEDNFLQFSKRLNTSSPTLKSKFDLLIQYKIIYRSGIKVRLTCDNNILDILDKTIPLKMSNRDAKVERLQRKLVQKYINKHREENQLVPLKQTN